MCPLNDVLPRLVSIAAAFSVFLSFLFCHNRVRAEKNKEKKNKKTKGQGGDELF